MKKYIFPVTISILSCLFFVSIYFLYSDDTSDIKPKKLEEINTVNIKESIQKREKKLLGYKPQVIDEQAFNKKIVDLKDMLKKTENMLKEYNATAEHKIISSQDINRLVSLDFEQRKQQKLPTQQLENKSDNTTKQETTLNNNDATNPISSNSFVTTGSIESNNNTTQAITPAQATNSSATSSSSTTNNVTIVAEVQKLQTQIEDVKKVISQVSSNIN